MAAHLGGVIAAHTTVPVIGIPIKSTLEGMDALWQQSKCLRVSLLVTVGIDNGTNGRFWLHKCLLLNMII